jgi:hypothetical protein
MAVNEIPLNPYPENFLVTLDDKEYTMATSWCASASTWMLSVSTSAGPVLSGAPLIPGVDLLAQYTNLGFKGQLVAQVDHDKYAVPSFSGLGITGHLYYITP